MTKAEREEKINFLKSYKWLMFEISQERADLSWKEDRLYGIRTPKLSDMPRGGSPVTIDTLVADKVDLEREVKQDESACDQRRALIEASINAMADPRDRAILKLKFLRDFTHEMIAEHIHYSVTQTRHFYELALEHYVIPDIMCQ